MRQDIDLTNFTKGELSPLMKGRIDVGGYYNGVDTLLNMVVRPQGGATRRPGTMMVALAKDQSPVLFRTRMIPFTFSVIQAYQLEFSNGNVRVYMNDGVVLNAGTPVDIAVPYQAADLAAIKFCQSADTLYLFHPNYPPASLGRSSHTSWAYAVLAFRDGPYLKLNTTATTLTPSAQTGAIVITASAIVGINVTPQSTGQGFLAGDVGRTIRIKVNAVWGWVLITAVNSTTSINATVQPAVLGTANGADGQLDGIGATASWQLGKWCATNGYPYAGTFWQQRLFPCGTNNEPNAVEGSVVGDFTSLAPTDKNGTVTASHAMSWIISDDQVNAIRWLSAAGSAQGAQLGIGTVGSEHIFQAATTGQALSPTNVQTYRETTLGAAANAPALRIGKSVLFVNRAGRSLHEWTFTWQVNGYIGPDLCEFSEHVTRSGIAEMAYQQIPFKVIWARRNDGALIGFTYDREQQVFAPHRHQLGGQYYGGPPIVESVACIPSPDGTYDELWLSVVRTISGTPTRFIEVMTRYFDAMPLEQAFFVDCGLTSALTFPAATLTPSGFVNSAPPGVQPATMPPSLTGIGTLAASAAIFSAGSVSQVVRLNGGTLVVTGYTDAQHVTAQAIRGMTNLAPAAANAWSMTPLSTTFSGLGYLNGEKAAILGDGAVYPAATVAGGTVSTGGAGASLATVGLPYGPVIVSMPFEPQRAAVAASAGKAKRVDTMWVRFHESLGCDFGRRMTDPMTKAVGDRLEPLQSRSASDPMGQAPALFSGAKRLFPQGGFDNEGQVIITQEDPLPLTVLAVFAKADVGDMPQP